MAAYSITAANVLASSQAIKDTSHNYGTTVTQGQPVYLDVNGLYQLSNTLTSATTAQCSGIALNAGSPNQPANVCLSDVAFTPGFTLASGVPVVCGSTAGALNPVSDLATGWFTTVVMVPISTTQAILKPVAGGAAHA